MIVLIISLEFRKGSWRRLFKAGVNEHRSSRGLPLWRICIWKKLKFQANSSLQAGAAELFYRLGKAPQPSPVKEHPLSQAGSLLCQRAPLWGHWRRELTGYSASELHLLCTTERITVGSDRDTLTRFKASRRAEPRWVSAKGKGLLPPLAGLPRVGEGTQCYLEPPSSLDGQGHL